MENTNTTTAKLETLDSRFAESKSKLWIGRIMSWLIILFMLFDGIMKFFLPAEVVESTQNLGFSPHHFSILGTLALISAVLYAIPRTAVLGAILLTAYFGGAIATHLRLDNPLFSHTLFPVYFGILTWGGLWLTNKKLRYLIPFNRKGQR